MSTEVHENGDGSWLIYFDGLPLMALNDERLDELAEATAPYAPPVRMPMSVLSGILSAQYHDARLHGLVTYLRHRGIEVDE